MQNTECTRLAENIIHIKIRVGNGRQRNEVADPRPGPDCLGGHTQLPVDRRSTLRIHRPNAVGDLPKCPNADARSLRIARTQSGVAGDIGGGVPLLFTPELLTNSGAVAVPSASCHH